MIVSRDCPPIFWMHEQARWYLVGSIPYLYTAGNHDWHYEGMEGTSRELRDVWIQKRLLPLYQDRNPLITRRTSRARAIFLDNSTYEILPEQLEMFLKLLETDLPVILFVHISLYAPGRPLDFGCGHPQWNAASDRYFKTERRPPWRESGHTRTTLDFHREVFAASNLLAVFAGHTHQASVDLLQGIPQLLTGVGSLFQILRSGDAVRSGLASVTAGRGVPSGYTKQPGRSP